MALAPHLARDPRFSWVVAVAPEWAGTFTRLGMDVHLTTVPFTSPIAPLTLAVLQRKVKPDATFCPSFVPAFPSRGPLVMTIHDMTHLSRPADYSWLHRAYYRLLVLPVARRASAVITVSEFSKRQIEEIGGVAHVSVVYPGIDHELFTPDGPRHPRVGARSIVYAGGFKPHKRVDLLVRALPHIDDVNLVLVGEPPPGLLELARTLGVDRRVVELGSISDDELAAAYRAGSVFVFPSALEGFGFPPLEAMACGTPAVVADGSSLSEVVDGGGLLFGTRVGEPAHQISRVLSDPAFADALRAAGLERSKKFTWDGAASLIADIIASATLGPGLKAEGRA